MLFDYELGLVAKDKITGFTGVITVRCQFLTGCNRYCLQPRELKDGKPLDSIYFDEAQIEILSEGISPESVQGKDRGACSPDPK